jgi:hypothetical protein
MSELHFFSVGYEGIQVVEASNIEEAKEMVESDKYQNVYYQGSESDIKDNLEDENTEVVHL